MKRYYVYIMANRFDTVFYVGVTNNINRRVSQHKRGLGSRFTGRYRVTKLLYFEAYGEVKDAIRREKQVKGWTRKRKLELVQHRNPEMKDLADLWE